MTRLTLCLFCIGCSLPAAELLVYEPFSGSGKVADTAGGSGFAGAWTDGHNQIVADNLASKLGETPATSAGSLQLTAPDWASKRQFAQPLGGKPGSWYLSYLIRNDTGEQPENYASVKLFAGESEVGGLGKSWMGDKWTLFGPGKEAATQASCVTTNAAFVVVKLTYAGGADSLHAWVDPELASEPAVADAEVTGIALAPADRVVVVAKKKFSIDEIRIGTTWAAVCPAK